MLPTSALVRPPFLIPRGKEDCNGNEDARLIPSLSTFHNCPTLVLLQGCSVTTEPFWDGSTADKHKELLADSMIAVLAVLAVLELFLDDEAKDHCCVDLSAK